LRSLSGGGPGDPQQRKTSVVMRRYACNKRLANDADDRQRKAKAAEPSLPAGLLVDARGQRLTPSHAVKKFRRYRYYVSAALITEAGTDRARRRRRAALRAAPEAVDLFLDPAHTAELNVRAKMRCTISASSGPARPRSRIARRRFDLCYVTTVTSCRHRNPSEHGML
jgi:hypothetical protein